jgi:hypothetical protein
LNRYISIKEDHILSALTLLEVLEYSLSTILEKLEKSKKNELIDLLRRLRNAEDENTIQGISDQLYYFCLENPLLDNIIATSGVAEPKAYRGKPLPKSLTKETNQIRLLANRLIDAIDKAGEANSEKNKASK